LFESVFASLVCATHTHSPTNRLLLTLTNIRRVSCIWGFHRNASLTTGLFSPGVEEITCAQGAPRELRSSRHNAACVRSPWFHRLISRGRIIIYFQSHPSRKLASRSKLKALTGQRSSSVLDAEENSRRERTQRTMSKRRPYVESVTSFSVFPATRIYTSVFIIVQVAKMLAIDDESG